MTLLPLPDLKPCPFCGSTPFMDAQPVQQPALAEWTTPTTLAQRMSDAVTLLCNGKRPPDDMVAEWLDAAADDHRLQEFAVEHGPAWAQGIGLLDAARVMADQPTEGVAHEVSQPVQQPGAEPEPITVEAVAEVRSGDDGLYLDWLIEGGVCALVEGCVLVMPSQPITDDEGSGEVYLAAPAQRQPLHITHLIDWLAARYRAAGGKEGITDVSAWAEEVMRWTEAAHNITAAPAAQKGEKL